ncbi:MAG: glutamate-1-semialdehyde-2,1-aminomutase [Salinibacterium sp.]|nr:MAG: glutamate-1-semialdehyde-2,1-aminomutase [Salinibacterium sp.]
MTTNDEAFARARAVLPGGVNSPVRAYGSVGGVPRSFVSGRGPYVTDVEGREHVDLVGAWGPALLGHAHPAVVDAVQRAAEKGFGFGASTPAESDLAELIKQRVGSELIGKVRLVSTGTEATMTAIRLARGATGRDLVVKFAGHYHGHSDGLLADAGSGIATLGIPGSAGIPAAVAAQTVVIPYNDLNAVRQTFAELGPRIAAVIVEAAAANMGVVPPEPGFNAAIAGIVHENGALLILDEVLTGFRVSASGWWGLEANDYVADLVTYGKVIGGGLPLAALAGRAEIMDLLAPAGPVYQAGTLSGNPIALAAGIATLNSADSSAYRHIDSAATTISNAASDALAAVGVAHSVQHAGNLFSVAFRATPPRNYGEVKAQQAFRYPPFFHAMLDAGVSLPPSVFEAWFVSAAHDDGAINRILDALPGAARAASQASA